METRTCCFCFDLKQGTVAVGVFTVTTKLLGIVAFGVLLGITHKQGKDEDLYTSLDIIAGVYIGVCAVSALFGVLLIVGAKKSIRGLFIPWMVLSVLEMVSLGYSFFGSLVFITQWVMIVQAISSFAGAALLVYMFWCVCSYYRSIPPNNVPYQGFTDEGSQVPVPSSMNKCDNPI